MRALSFSRDKSLNTCDKDGLLPLSSPLLPAGENERREQAVVHQSPASLEFTLILFGD